MQGSTNGSTLIADEGSVDCAVYEGSADHAECGKMLELFFSKKILMSQYPQLPATPPNRHMVAIVSGPKVVWRVLGVSWVMIY